MNSSKPLDRRLRMRLACLAAVALLLCLGAARAAVTVRFEVDMAAEISAGRFVPERDQVGLRGSTAPLSWGRPLLLQALGSGRYGLSVRFAEPPPDAQPLQHKFRIEREGAGNDEGWEPGRNHALALDAPVPHVARRFGAEAALGPRRISGTVESLGVLPSAHVTPRAVQVWLPPGYAGAPERRYPVLYLHDGQNVFDAAAAGAEWQVDETAQRLVSAGTVEPMLIVAVASGPHRTTDYTPTAGAVHSMSSWFKPQVRIGGGAPAYAQFLASELKPLIDARYRTRPDPTATAVGGSSLGGLVSLWLLLHHPQTFGAALVVSPSLWWDDGFAARDLATLWLPAQARPRVWLDMGGQESAWAVPAARRLRDTLRARGWNDATLAYLEVPEGRHDEASWAARVEGMLTFLYGRMPRPPENAASATRPAP